MSFSARHKSQVNESFALTLALRFYRRSDSNDSTASAEWVSGNWRLIFEFDGTDAVAVDLVDYH
jgi:plasmid maintenance system killer protein